MRWMMWWTLWSANDKPPLWTTMEMDGEWRSKPFCQSQARVRVVSHGSTASPPSRLLV